MKWKHRIFDYLLTYLRLTVLLLNLYLTYPQVSFVDRTPLNYFFHSKLHHELLSPSEGGPFILILPGKVTPLLY